MLWCQSLSRDLPYFTTSELCQLFFLGLLYHRRLRFETFLVNFLTNKQTYKKVVGNGTEARYEAFHWVKSFQPWMSSVIDSRLLTSLCIELRKRHSLGHDLEVLVFCKCFLFLETPSLKSVWRFRHLFMTSLGSMASYTCFSEKGQFMTPTFKKKICCFCVTCASFCEDVNSQKNSCSFLKWGLPYGCKILSSTIDT
jgi:hypothetical protein